MEKIIKAALKKCEKAEVYYHQSTTTPVSFQNSKLKSLQTKGEQLICLRVVKDGKIGYATTTRADDYQDLIDNAIAVAQFGGDYNFEFPAGKVELPAPNIFDEAVEEMKVEAIVETGQGLIDSINAEFPEANGFASLERDVSQVRVLNSEGREGSYSKTTYSGYFGAVIVEGQNMLQVYAVDGSTHLSEVSFEDKVEEVLEDLRIGQENVDLRQGTYPVLLTPMAVGDLIAPVIACVNGRAVEKGMSPWADKLSEDLFNPAITLVDNGIEDLGPGSIAMDSEGIPGQRTEIIKEGQLTSFIHDLRSAAALKMEPTGNGLRRGTSAPSPTGSNMMLLPGDRPYADLMASIDQGLVVDALMGAWAGNPYAGEVSGNIALGFKVEKGKKVGRVKDCMFSVNALKALKEKLLGLSQETRWTQIFGTGLANLPYVLLDGVNISTKS